MCVNTKAGLSAVCPDDLIEKILEDGGAHNLFENVYRVAYMGIINRDAFLNSCEQSLRDNIHIRDSISSSDNYYDIGDYSTSCFENLAKVKSILKCMKKHREGPVLINGPITPESGYSMRTADSRTGRKAGRSHIDWWIYEQYDPSNLFTLTEVK